MGVREKWDEIAWSWKFFSVLIIGGIIILSIVFVGLMFTGDGVDTVDRDCNGEQTNSGLFYEEVEARSAVTQVQYDGNDTILVIYGGLTCSLFIVDENGSKIDSIEVPEHDDTLNVSSLEEGEEFKVIGAREGQEVVIAEYTK